MNLAHIHLLLNHWPVIGSFLGLGLFLVALVSHSDDLKQAALVFFAIMALLAIPTYMSGDVANEVLKGSAGLPKELIQAHQGTALLSLILMELTGGVALLGLWRFSRMSRPGPGSASPLNSAAVLLLSIVTAGLMAVTGNTGGAIRHSEIFAGQGTASTIANIGLSLVPATTYFVTGYS